MVHSPRNVFIQLRNCRETCFYEHGNFGLMASEVFSSSEANIVVDLHVLEKRTISFSSALQQMIWSCY